MRQFNRLIAEKLFQPGWLFLTYFLTDKSIVFTLVFQSRKIAKILFSISKTIQINTFKLTEYDHMIKMAKNDKTEDTYERYDET